MHCPRCQSENYSKYGKTYYGKQRYRCRDCGRQFGENIQPKTMSPHHENRIRDILTQAKVIAVVGHSHKPDRPSYQVAQFLRHVGYNVYAVNPTVKEIDGYPSYSSLFEVPEAIDIVNVFRSQEYLHGIVEDAIAISAKTVWAQLGIYDSVAAQKAKDSGLLTVMDRCIKIDYQQLLMER